MILWYLRVYVCRTVRTKVYLAFHLKFRNCFRCTRGTWGLSVFCWNWLTHITFAGRVDSDTFFSGLNKSLPCFGFTIFKVFFPVFICINFPSLWTSSGITPKFSVRNIWWPVFSSSIFFLTFNSMSGWFSTLCRMMSSNSPPMSQEWHR